MRLVGPRISWSMCHLPFWKKKYFSFPRRSVLPARVLLANLLGPRAQEALRDYDPIESVRWAEWVMLRSATILKSIEPCLTMVDEVNCRNNKLLGDLKVLDLQKVVLEEEKAEAISVKLKAEEDLRMAGVKLEALGKEKDQEIERLRLHERFRGLVAKEKVRADLAKDPCWSCRNSASS
ncbi:hypothetical protein PIB30_031748 [Stylosanthes scabra]|uniref:Uncharacterized protein n=1 Tax=Stylosanthes scabra TaxID=79078 RepID=A0ABU6VB49_9FABA|nr:hypothetical protein [Stylosanthes scabra]